MSSVQAIGLEINDDLYGHGVAFVKILGFADAGFDGHDVVFLFGEQGGLIEGFADPHLHRQHAPTIGHEVGYNFQVAALLQGDGHEEPGRGATPEPDYALELDIHR